MGANIQASALSPIAGQRGRDRPSRRGSPVRLRGGGTRPGEARVGVVAAAVVAHDQLFACKRIANERVSTRRYGGSHGGRSIVVELPATATLRGTGRYGPS